MTSNKKKFFANSRHVLFISKRAGINKEIYEWKVFRQDYKRKQKIF